MDPEASLEDYNELLDLGGEQGVESTITAVDWAFEKIQRALQTNSAVLANRTEGGGAWVVDLTSQRLGQVKVFDASSSNSSSLEFENSTLIVRTLMQLAYHFEEGKEGCARYIWIVPEGRKHFADQVLCLAGIIFNDYLDEQDSTGGETTFESNSSNVAQRRFGSRSWANMVEVVLYDPSSGPDLWGGSGPNTSGHGGGGNKDSSPLDIRQGIHGLIDYATLRMKEVVVENRGEAQDMDDDSGDMTNDDTERPALDEASLLRMATILSKSALVVVSVGTRLRKKIQMDLTKILDGKGNSGVFLQYVQSRLCG